MGGVYSVTGETPAKSAAQCGGIFILLASRPRNWFVCGPLCAKIVDVVIENVNLMTGELRGESSG
jgi:hypothetical protein